jgi:WD40 repeat protein
MASLRTPVLDDMVGGAHHEGDVLCCAFAPGPLWVASGGADGQILQWDLNTGIAGAWWRADEKAISSCVISPDGTRLWTGSASGALAVWDSASHAMLGRLLAHARPISGLAMSPTGHFLAETSWDGTIVLRSPDWPQNATSLTGHRDMVSGCKFTPDGQKLISWSHDKTMVLWDVQAHGAISVFSGHQDRVVACDVTPNGEWLASGSRDGALVLWHAEERRQVAEHQQEDELRTCFFTPDGELLVSLWANGDLLGHSVPEFDIRIEQTTGMKPHCGAIFGTGAPLAVGSSDGRLHFLNPDGLASAPLWTTAIEMERQIPATGLMARLQKKSVVQRVFYCTCPSCHFVFTLATNPGETTCPSCQRPLRLNRFTFAPPASWQAQFRAAAK